ncbi:MAG: nucleotidyltransferase [Bacteroidetes bacterium]|nr:nucleotidyltransferase [Bacteroidota bacterium]
MDLIQSHTKELNQACEQSQVKELYVFGSVLTDQFDSESDIDFIVTIDESDPLEYTEYYFQLKFALEKIFSRKIDLLEQKAIRNDLFREMVDREKQLVYVRRSQRLA